MDIDEYVSCFKNKQQITEPLTGFYARVLRGKKEKDFLTLSNDTKRQIVFVMDEFGMMDIIGNSTYDILIKAGYYPNYIDQLYDENTSFKLVVFPTKNPKILATWDHVLDIIPLIYPELLYLLEKFRKDLNNLSFEEIEKQAGFRFCDVKNVYDRRYMTYSRLNLTNPSLIEIRSFLYHSLYLREYFTGDGFTKNYKGEKVFREYLFFNTYISNLNDYRIIDLEIGKKRTLICPLKSRM